MNRWAYEKRLRTEMFHELENLIFKNHDKIQKQQQKIDYFWSKAAGMYFGVKLYLIIHMQFY